MLKVNDDSSAHKGKELNNFRQILLSLFLPVSLPVVA